MMNKKKYMIPQMNIVSHSFNLMLELPISNGIEDDEATKERQSDDALWSEEQQEKYSLW